MHTKKFHEFDEAAIQRALQGRTVVDKGTVLLENEQDEALFMRYIAALQQGEEFYRPEGLRFLDQ